MRPRSVALTSLVMLTLAGCREGGGDGLVAEVGRAAGGAREPGPRLSISATARCSDLPGAELSCPERRRRRREGAARELAARAAAAMRERVDADALHAAGLIDLLWADSAGRSLDRSIQSLRSAAQVAEHPAPILADLAAALLVRAERAGQPRDLFEAAEAAAEAVEADSGSVAGRFNLALALEEIGLVDASAQAWEGYLARDGRSRWASRARGRLAALRRPPPALPPLERPEHAAAFAAASPQEALYGGFDRLLAEWGAAVLAGDSVRAAERLALAEAVGAALVRRGGDASLADAVAAARVAADARGLAAAHARYGEARRMYVEARYGDAAAAFGKAIGEIRESTPLRGWATLFRGAALFQARQVEMGASLIRRVAAEADTARHPSLAGRAAWSVGTTALREGADEEALASYRMAERLFARMGEWEHVGAMRCSAAGMEFELGDERAALDGVPAALGALRAYPASVWLHGCLVWTAYAASGEGFSAAAAAADDEDVAVTERGGKPMLTAESRLFRARSRIRTGNLRGAAADLARGATRVARIDDPVARRWFAADLASARAALDAAEAGAASTAALDTAVAFFSAPTFPLRLVPVLTLRARAHAARGDAARAADDLRAANGVLGQVRSRVQRASIRASMADAAAETLDELVRIEVARGRPDAALRALESGRAVLRDGEGEEATEPVLVGPDGSAVVTYAMIGDTLHAWTIRGQEVRLARIPVSRAEFGRSVARLRVALEVGGAGTEAELERLHRWLIAPLAARLGPPGTPLVVVADGAIGAVPFSALRDAGRGRFLVEDRPVRFAPSLAAAALGGRVRRSGVPLLISDPAFDPALHPALSRLPDAEAEVAAIRSAYPAASLLHGAEVTLDAVRSGLAGASLVHFAGHAVFDEGAPERSHLVLAGHGRLTTRDVDGLDLRGVELVVLSACRSIPGRDGRSGGLAGLAGSLMEAGAGGVLGSLWEIDDDRTRPLMEAFHREYRLSPDAAAALQRAQLSMLHSPDPRDRAPAAWAGFRYLGR